MHTRDGLSRRQFLRIAGEKLRRLSHGVVVVIVAAFIAMFAVQVVPGITVEGWGLIGCFVLVAVLLAGVRWGAVRVYSMLPKRGKALCDAAGEAFDTLLLVAVGILVCRQFQTGKEEGAFVVSLFMLAWIVQRVRKVYDQKMGQ